MKQSLIFYMNYNHIRLYLKLHVVIDFFNMTNCIINTYIHIVNDIVLACLKIIENLNCCCPSRVKL